MYPRRHHVRQETVFVPQLFSRRYSREPFNFFLCYFPTTTAQYWIQGALGGPIHNKILWPAVILTLSLKSTQDSYYAANRVALDMANEYRTYPSNVSP